MGASNPVWRGWTKTFWSTLCPGWAPMTGSSWPGREVERKKGVPTPAGKQQWSRVSGEGSEWALDHAAVGPIRCSPWSRKARSDTHRTPSHCPRRELKAGPAFPAGATTNLCTAEGEGAHEEDGGRCLLSLRKRTWSLLARAPWFFPVSFSTLEPVQTCSVSLSEFHGPLPGTGAGADGGLKAGLWSPPFSV